MSTAATATSSAAPSSLVPPPASVPEASSGSGASPDNGASTASSTAAAATAAGPSSGGVTSTATTNASNPSPSVLSFPLFSATAATSTSSSSRLQPHSPASSSFISSHAAHSISVPSPATAISTATAVSTMTNANAPNNINPALNNHSIPNANPAIANQAPAPAIHTAAPSITATLPSSSNPRHVAEARAALVATVSNLLDTELQGRASLLHGNAAALERQRRDVSRAAEGLRRENDRLARLARDAGKAVKELGNVQNWAEVLERDFLVLEETVRLVKRGDGEEDEEDGGSSDGSGGSCSCSECWSGSETGSVVGGAGDAAGPDSRVKVELSDAVVESLAEAMATEGFFKAAAVDKGNANANSNGRGSATGDREAAEFRDESATAEVAPAKADSIRAQ
ncbi:hypothetical protein DL770_000137 [Monosporascus sp. CRB-9-2]|nr:hypothetical protein DL770_000137 [Monosporascus sp. CRB-9-2]